VTDDRIDPSEQIPEADLLDQQTALDAALTDDEPALAGHDTAVGAVDEADRWEQQQPVPEAEDDYPHGLLETG